MKRSSIIGRLLLVGVLIAVVGTACQLNTGLQDLNLPFVPTETNTPVPTATITPTPTIPPKPDTSSELFKIEVMVNDSSVFTDVELGYQLVLSPEWLAFPVDEDIPAEVLAENLVKLQESGASLIAAPLAQSGIRMVAVDYSRKYEVTSGYMSNIHISLDETPALIELGLGDILDQMVEEIPELLPGANPIYQAIQTNTNGVKYALLIITFDQDLFGAPAKIIRAMYKLETGLLVIAGAGHEDSFQEMERSIKTVFESLELVE
jgi:hypothetical protein